MMVRVLSVRWERKDGKGVECEGGDVGEGVDNGNFLSVK